MAEDAQHLEGGDGGEPFGAVDKFYEIYGKSQYLSRYLYSASKYELLNKNGCANMNNSVNEEELLEILVPRVESRISSKIVQRIIDALREELYPPEDMIREEFVNEIEEAETEEGITFKNINELESYLKGLAE